MRDRVLIVGYSPRIAGGVTTVVKLLRENIPCLELHVALRRHRPRWKSLAFSVYSVLTFALRLLVAAPRVIQPIIGSRGDAVRMLPYVLLAKLRGCRVCLNFHTNMAAILDDLPLSVRGRILSVWRLADGYCFLSSRLRGEFTARLTSQKPHVVIPNPISEEWLRQDILPRTERTRGLVFLGRWSREKGKEELLAAMRSFDCTESVRCDIYSDHCPRENPLNCECHSWLGEDEVRQVLRESKLLLLPSHAEAFPMVLLEAAACGTPFVASNVAGIPDIAEESQAGLLHDVGDVEGMRSAIAKLLSDDALWTRCCCSGRRWVESLEVSNIVPRWNRLYVDLGVRIPSATEGTRSRTAPA